METLEIKNTILRAAKSMSRGSLMAEQVLPQVCNSKFHYRKGNHEYFAFKSYLPVRYDVNQEELISRKLVYNFKDGYQFASEEGANLVI